MHNDIHSSIRPEFAVDSKRSSISLRFKKLTSRDNTRLCNFV